MKRIERVDLAVHSRQLRKQAAWCGLVFSLAVLFSVLNFLPPVPVRYEVTGKILVEPARVAGLVRNLKQSTAWSEPVVLRDFQVLARSQAENPPQLASFQGSDRVFLLLKSLWHNRCTSPEFNSWAESVTQLAAQVPQDTDLANRTRLARWELAAAEHYRNHHEFLTSKNLSREDSAPRGVADSGQNSSKDSGKFQFAGLEVKPSAGHLVAGSNDPNSGLATTAESVSALSETSSTMELAEQLQLETNVAIARQRLDSLELNISQSLEKIAGEITLVDVPQVVPISNRIPTWLALSVLVLLFSAGGIAGSIYFRLQSGGIYNPQEVAQQLASQRLPVVATVQLPSDQLASSDWLEIAGRQASGAGRKTARNLTRISEAILAFWCIAILGRLLLDPMWRLVFIDSPLAAFCRLFWGLP